LNDRKPGGFRSNPNKNYIRSRIDKPLIRKWSENAGRHLEYLGLPGWEMLDIVEWQSFLANFSTIEREEREQHRLYLTANVRDVEHRLHALYGDFDDILITGRDKYGRMPRWPYDVVNLDFYGGLLYSDLRRPMALRKLIENQAAHERSFLLIVTHDLRDSDRGREKQSFLTDMHKFLARGISMRASTIALDWYERADTPDAARQSVYTNVFLHDVGENHQFHVTCRTPLVYVGTGGTKMIHYTTDFAFRRAAHRIVSDQSIVDILNLGVHEVADERVLVAFETPYFGIA